MQYADALRENLRDQFVAALRQWLFTHAYSEATESLNDHLSQVALCEPAYRGIYKSLEMCPAGQVSPAVSAWATLRATAADITEVFKAVVSVPPVELAPDLLYLSAELMRVNVFGRPDLDPDVAAERYASNLGGYLKMLGYRHGWFDGGALVIPVETVVPTHLQDDRSSIYLAEAWNQLDHHWEMVRYFKSSSIRSELRSYPTEGGTREIETLIFDHDWQYGLEIEVARGRLRQKVFETMMHVVHSSLTGTHVQDPTQETVDVFPRGLISVQEGLGMLVLDMCYGLNLKKNQNEYLGLRLAEWLRGYALIQLCCERDVALNLIEAGIAYLDLESFLQLAQRAGMHRDRTLLFIKQATFQRNSRDLWDAPLIRCADGRYIVLPSLTSHCALHEAVASRINSLLLHVASKGRDFEEEVREQFARIGAVAKRIAYRTPEGNFECDAAVLWGQDLFLVECKAYSVRAA